MYSGFYVKISTDLCLTMTALPLVTYHPNVAVNIRDNDIVIQHNYVAENSPLLTRTVMSNITFNL